MGVQTRTRPLVGKYAFTVHGVSGGEVAKFQKCSGLEMTIAVGEYREGGAMAPMKEDTTASFANATLEHGVMEDTELYDWVLSVVDIMADLPTGSGIASPNHLRNLSIRQRRRDRTVLRTVRCFNCQPTRFVPGDFDNTSTEIQVETLEFAYEYFTLDT